MNINQDKQGILTENSLGIGTVTKEMVGARAAELAVINGRNAQDVSISDWEQAKRELTGGPDMESKEAVIEMVPGSESWDPVPGSAGHKAQEIPGDDEDDEGRSNSERLVQEGVGEAEHNQMLEAARTQKEEEE